MHYFRAIATTATMLACFSAFGYSPLNSANSRRVATRLFATTAGGMQQLPSDVVKYNQVPQRGCFTADKIPKGLLKAHTTKAGTWGVICVKRGLLQYQINEPVVSIHTLDSTVRGIIEPQIKHEVSALSDDLEFVVEFHRLPGTGPVDEKRE